MDAGARKYWSLACFWHLSCHPERGDRSAEWRVSVVLRNEHDLEMRLPGLAVVGSCRRCALTMRFRLCQCDTQCEATESFVSPCDA